MNRRSIPLWILVLVMLFAVVPAGCSGEEEASGPVVCDRVESLEDFFNGPCLAYDTIPEEARVEDPFMSNRSVFICYYGRIYNNPATVLEMTPVSGDEDFLDAITYENEQLTLDYKKLTHPGDLTVHIHAEFTSDYEAQTWIHDGDYTLHVVAYEGPVVEFREDVNELTVGRGTIPTEEFLPMVARYADYAQGMRIQTVFLNGAGTDSFSGSFLEEGDNQVWVRLDFGPVEYSKEFLIHLYPYEIQAGRKVFPGQTIDCSVVRYDMWNHPELAQGFEWSVEGAGAEVTEDGELTVAQDAKAGDTLLLKATRASDGFSLEHTVTVEDFPWNTGTFRIQPVGDFGVPVPEGDLFRTNMGQDESGNYTITSQSADGELSFEYIIGQSRDYSDRRLAVASLKKSVQRMGGGRLFNLNGIPALVYASSRFEDYEQIELDDGSYDRVGIGNISSWSVFVRLLSATSLSLNLEWTAGEGESLPDISLDDVMPLVARFTVAGVPASIMEQDPVPEILPAGDATYVVEGGSVQFAVSDESLARTEQWGKIIWNVEMESGRNLKNVKISEDGLLTVGKGAVKEYAANLVVYARYANASEFASCSIQAVPALKGVRLSSTMEGDYGYVGFEEWVAANADPYGAALGGGTWTIDKPELVEIISDEDVTRTNRTSLRFKPLQPGKITVTFVADSGVKASKKYTLADNPVTDVKIELKSGQPKAGGKMQFKAVLTPEKPAYPKVYWTVDVDDSIATINPDKGTLQIKKGVESGTVITVTLYAHGAPETLSDTMEITVE